MVDQRIGRGQGSELRSTLQEIFRQKNSLKRYVLSNLSVLHNIAIYCRVFATKSTEIFFSYDDSMEKFEFEFEFEIPSAYFLWRPVIDKKFFPIVLHILA